jgi:hypothetical protein
MVSLADTDELYCSNCAEEYGLSEVRQHVDRWVKTLAWLDAAPRAEEDSE